MHVRCRPVMLVPCLYSERHEKKHRRFDVLGFCTNTAICTGSMAHHGTCTSLRTSRFCVLYSSHLLFILVVGDSQAAYGLDVRCPVEESKCWTVAMKPLGAGMDGVAAIQVALLKRMSP